MRAEAKRALQEIWMPETEKDAVKVLDAFAESRGTKYDKAVLFLEKASNNAGVIVRELRWVHIPMSQGQSITIAACAAWMGLCNFGSA